MPLNVLYKTDLYPGAVYKSIIPAHIVFFKPCRVQLNMLTVLKVIGTYLLLLVVNMAVAQKTLEGLVTNGQNDEPVAFASVTFKNTGKGRYTDAAGRFVLVLADWPGDTVIVTCVGYQPYTTVINKNADSLFLKIVLTPGTFNQEAVVHSKGEKNKGLYVWKRIVQNKAHNDRFRFENFSYEIYNKLELDFKNIGFDKVSKIKPLRSIGEILTNSMDSSEGVKLLPAYLTEALSDYYYQKKPLRRREIIKAANTRGVNNESILKYLGGTDQVINVYNDFIPVMDKQFVSPISTNGDLYYDYSVADTQQVGQYRYYHLVFTPRRSGTNTFEGDCWVHTLNWGVLKMNLRVGATANINFIENLTMVQEYSFLGDSLWFVSKDKFVANIAPLGKNSPAFIGRKTATYRNVLINDSSVIAEVAKNKLQEEIITLPGARDKDSSFWGQSRHENLSKTEAGIIKMIDTLLNTPSFNKLTDNLNFLATGYKDIGNFVIGPWYNWATATNWEGFRLRFDLGTNRKFDSHWWWHFYLAYGFKDQRLKGKGELFYLPSKHPRQYIYGSYTNDMDFGQNYYGEITTDNIFALAIRKPGIALKYLKINEKKLELFNEHRSGFSELLSFTHKKYTPLQNLPGRENFVKPGSSGNPLTTFEIGVRLRFAYLEKFLENTFFRYSLGSVYPIGEVNITQGVAGFLKSNYNYTKVNISVSDYMQVPPVGNLSYQVYAGKTFGTLPYMLLDMAPGNEMYYYNKYAFNMMNRFEFLHDRYAGINFEHNIGSGIFRLFPKLKLRQLYTAKFLWGGLSAANRELNFVNGHSFQTLGHKTYMEVGTGIDNILKVLRLDFVWRVLPASGIANTTKNFGIFGSFRLAF